MPIFIRNVSLVCAGLLAVVAGCAQKHETVVGSKSGIAPSSHATVTPDRASRWHARRELLIVDDTRFRGDQVIGGSLVPPLGAWPTAAELDTFLFARGGAPWRGYPAGTPSPPGVFAGYDFDTLGTRTGRPDLTVPLDVLRRYQYVVWIVDARGALNFRGGEDPISPATALRYMDWYGRTNTLAEYVNGGGKAWLLGGGVGVASTAWRNRHENDAGGLNFTADLGELAPGVFMYDQPHWRSGFRSVMAAATILPSRALPPSRQRVPDYGLLPAELDLKSPASDPLPPLRRALEFYPIAAAIEYLSLPNEVRERRCRSSENPRYGAVLDSLYRAVGGSIPGPESVCMTSYHGFENGGVVFSGFDLWSWRRQQCVQLVDAVLHGIWGLNRSARHENHDRGDDEGARSPRR